MPGLHALLCLLALPPANLGPAGAQVAWRPLRGDLLWLRDGGRELILVDVLGAEVGRWRFESTRVDAIAAYAGRWWLQPAGGGWSLLPEPAPPSGALSPKSLERPRRPGLEPPRSSRGGAECPGPGGRRWTVGESGHSLRLRPATWEHRGEIQWGPGWAAVRFRSGRPLPAILWRRPGGGLDRLPVLPDASDPALRHAYLMPVHPGDLIRIRVPRVERRWPAGESGIWLELTAPEVDPGAERPVTVLAPVLDAASGA